MSQLQLFPEPTEQQSTIAPDITPPPSAPSYMEGLNPEQQAAVQASDTEALQVLAGAGTGKTELISRRFVKLLKDLRAKGISKPEERILVVTFTSDAARSMRARIHERLIQNGEEGLGPTAWISTFHQFCMRILRVHALEVGLAPDFTMLNVLEQQVLFQRMMQGILQGDYRDLSQHFPSTSISIPSKSIPSNTLDLNHLIQLGITDLEQLLDPDRLYRLINRIKTSGLSPQEFLDQSLEQSKRLTEHLKTLPVPHDKELDKLENMDLKISTWRDSLKPWMHTDWDPLRDAEQKAEQAGKKLTPGLMKDELKSLAKLYLMDRSFEPISPDFSKLDEAITQESQITHVIAAIYALYQQLLLAQNTCDFDDLINHVIHLLHTKPHLQQKYQNLFEALIVDEFQDSNGSQLRLLELLIRKNAQNLTVVGDEKQSIYGFRFAQPENLDLIFRNGSYQNINLQTNYRSYPAILSVANQLTKQISTKSHQQLNACERYTANTLPKVTWVNLNEMLESEETGKPSHKPIFEQKEREAHYIAVEISKLVQTGAYKFSDIAILVKSHGKAEEIQQILSQLSIPSVRQKNLGFFQEPVIKDAMALLALMHNLHDEQALVRLLQQKLNQKQIYTLMQAKTILNGEQPNSRLFDVCIQCLNKPQWLNLPDSVLESIGDLSSHLFALYKLKHRLSPAHLFLKLADEIGIISGETPSWQQKQQRIHLRTFEKLLYLFSQSKLIQPTLDEVLDILKQYAEHPEQELPVKEELSDEDAVQILTIYASKGLEYRVVFVAYTELGRIRPSDDSGILFDPQYPGKAGFGLILGKVNNVPNLKKELYQKCWLSQRSKTEAQRVFYVALTRAIEKLYVIRGSQSFPWTDPAGYPNAAIECLSEAEQSPLLNEIWNQDFSSLRTQMAVFQGQPETPSF